MKVVVVGASGLMTRSVYRVALACVESVESQRTSEVLNARSVMLLQTN